MDNNVLDEAVEVALGDMPAPLTYSQAWPNGYVDGYNDAMKVVEEQMRFSLLAAMPVLLGEPVAWLIQRNGNTVACMAMEPRPHAVADDEVMFPVYAPDLGGGK